jgi:redox-sensing transcriptional repressor
MRTASNPTINSIPEPSLRRLSIYYHLLQAMTLTGVKNVSCTQIAAALSLDPTQVRKDIETTGMAGKPKVGYPLTALVRWIETFLGLNHSNEAVLVGVGSLGSALLGYDKFRRLGFDLVAAFDTDPQKAGHMIAGREVFRLDRLVDIVRRRRILLGVIATPSAAAQSIADRMMEGGIRAIWNFAPVHLKAPPTIVLQNEDLYHSLASLSFRLDRMLAAERPGVVIPTQPAQERVYAKED